MSTKRATALILALMSCFCCFAQQTRDIDSFEKDASGKSLIYRGKLATRFNGYFDNTYFWDSADFKTGDLCLSGKVYRNVQINLDACNHKAVAMLPDVPVQVELPSDQVGWLSYDGRTFAFLKNGMVPKAPDGFYEILAPGVFKRVDKTLVGDIRGSEVVNMFIAMETYFQEKDGDLRRIGRNKASKLVAERIKAPAPSTEKPVTKVTSITQDVVTEGRMPESLAGVSLPGKYFDRQGKEAALAQALDNSEEEEEVQDGHMTREEVIALKGAAISADLMAKHRDSKMGVERMQVSTITHVPVAFGEADVLKVVLTLPGVKTVGEASSGFNVRGGSADQNLILFGDCTIYNPNHMFGIFSAFDTDVVRDVELYKSSIPAKYGGRISSVLNVKDKDGNPDKFTGSVGLGLLTSRLHLEGPVVKGKTTFNLGGRITYSNWLMNFLEGKSNYSGGRASFSDLTGSVTHKFDNRNSLHAFAYWSRDNFSFSEDTTFRYKNVNASLKWKSRFDGGGSMELTGGYNGYDNHLDNSFNEYASYTYTTAINEVFGKLDFKSPVGNYNTLSYGLSGLWYDMAPGTMTPLGELSLVNPMVLKRENALETGIYASDVWQPDYKFALEGGIRLSGFVTPKPSKFYCAPEFRLSAKYSFIPTLSAKLGFNSMRQYIHLISNTTSISPMDTWKLCNEKIKPQDGWQAAGGLYWTVIEKGLDLSLEGYYKRTWNTLDYKPGATLIMNPDLESELVATRGQAYGAELMAKKSVGKLTGWVSYTWSRSLLQEMEDRGNATINGGRWYCAPYDKPHDFKLVGNYKFTQRYSISLNVDYSTGRPVTVPVSVYRYGGGYRLNYSERNEFRIPDYFRMDLAMSIEPSHYLKQLTHMSVTFGVYNLTGRKNAYSVFYTTEYGYKPKGHMLSVFATQIPYINLNLKF